MKRSFLLLFCLLSTLTSHAQAWSIVGNNPLTNDIHGLNLYGSVLVMGGSFNNIPGDKIGYWDGTQFGTYGTGIGMVVRAVEEWNGKLLAVGDFWNNGQPCVNCNGVALWDGTSWGALGTGFDNDVLAITIWNGDPIVAGDFLTADGKSINRVARWTGTTWDSLGCGFNNDVRALEVYNGELYAGGDFSNACGNGSADRIARWDVQDQEWKGVVQPGGLDSTVRVLKVINNELWMGGHFLEVLGNTNCSGIAKYNGTAWSAVGSGVDSYVRAVEEYNGEVYIGGDFLNAGGIPAQRIARWDGTSWDSCGSGVSAYVRALQVYNGTLYVGGSFHVAGGITADYIAKWHIAAPIGGTVTSSVNVSCAGTCTGSATVAPTGGTSPYTYAWSTNAGSQTTATATGLCAGSYSCTITDSLGGQAVVNVTISQPSNGVSVNALVSSNYNGSQISCFGASDGAATASTTGGTGPYSYLWSPNAGGQTTLTASNLGTGTYYVTVTDAAGCSQVDSVNITAPSSVSASISNVVNVACFGNATGSVTAVGGGGTGSFSYVWNTVPIQSSATASGLIPGTYCVTVTDQNGCTASACTTITQAAQMTSTGSATSNYNGFNVSCPGSTNGTATVGASGGSGTYSYNWGTMAGGQTTASAINLAAGTYVVTITDQNNCTTTQQVVLNAPPAIAASTSMTQSSCGAADGSLTAVATGGVGGFGYAWDSNAGNQTTATAANLAAGIYSVTVTDLNGCSTVVSDTVTNPGGPSVSISNQSIPTCHDDCDGSATIVATGNGPFSYAWGSNAGNQTTATGVNLCAGSYGVTVTDVNGCMQISSVTLSNPAAISVSLSSTPTTSCNGTATVTPGGGIPPFTYLWDLAAGSQTTSTATGLCNQQYCVSVTDANNCTVDTCLTILLGTDSPVSDAVVFVYPNPASGFLVFQVAQTSIEEMEMNLYDASGKLVSTAMLTTGSNRLEGLALSAGVYFYRIHTASTLVSTGKVMFQ